MSEHHNNYLVEKSLFYKYTTLKDFKNAKIEIHKINNFLMYHFYGDLAKININMSRKHNLNSISK